MDISELIQIVNNGEDSRHQFKENIHNADSLAAEMIAFSNSEGGQIYIGVRDDGVLVGLDSADVARLNLLISNAASQGVRPSINPITENVRDASGTVLVVSIAKGLNKPYMDKNGVIWVKSGSDKRRATSREEIQRLFQQSGLLHADENPVPALGIENLDLPYFENFFRTKIGEDLVTQDLPLQQILTNMNLMQGGKLNIAGGLLFARTPQYAMPAFIVKAVSFFGNSIEDSSYIDSRDITGKLADMYSQTISFVLANLLHLQGQQGFNSLGEPEIPRAVWEELIANALLHRDYFVNAPIRVFVFANRVEIISPGHLPNNLTVVNIRHGNSNMRNPVLASFATRLIPYRGIGSGLPRAFRTWSDIDLIDDRENNVFKAIVWRHGLPDAQRSKD